jgi:amidase
MPLFGQELFVEAQATKGLDDPAYIAARDTAKRLAGPEGIDRLLAENQVVALIAPTASPAWPIKPSPVHRDHGGDIGELAAVAGYPHLTVPMGQVAGLPVGLSFIGPAWSEARLLSLGYAFEQINSLPPRPLAWGEYPEGGREAEASTVAGAAAPSIASRSPSPIQAGMGEDKTSANVRILK